MDNHTEMMDVAAGFARVLRNRNATLPPSSTLWGWETLLGLEQASPPGPHPASTNPTGEASSKRAPGSINAPAGNSSRRTQRNGSMHHLASGSLRGSNVGRGGNGPAGKAAAAAAAAAARQQQQSERAAENEARAPLRLVDAATMLFGQDINQAGAGRLAVSKLGLDQMLTIEEMVALMCALVEDRHAVYAGYPRLLVRLLCKFHLSAMGAIIANPVPWIPTRAMSARLLLKLDCGEVSQLMHQVYTYLTYGTGPDVDPLSMQPSSCTATGAHAVANIMARGEVSDLHLPLRDVRRGLRRGKGGAAAASGDTRNAAELGGSRYWVPLYRVAQFLRQAGLVPRIISKLITELIAVSVGVWGVFGGLSQTL